MSPTLDLVSRIERPRIQLESGEYELKTPDDMNLEQMVEIENLQKQVANLEQTDENIRLMSKALHTLIKRVFIGPEESVDSLTDIQCLRIMQFYQEHVPPFQVVESSESPNSNNSTAEVPTTG